MNIARWISFAVIAAALAQSQTPAGAANQIIQVPAGWTRADFGPGTILSPDSAPKNSVIVVLEGYPLGSGLRAAFDREFVKSTAGQRVLNTGELRTLRSPQGVEMLATTAEVQAADGSHSYRFYLGAETPGSMELLCYLASSAALLQRYLPEVQELIKTRQFANLPASAGTSASAATEPYAPLTASGDSDRLEGIYSGFKFVFATTLGAVQRSARSDYFTFFRDGTVYNGLPDHGLVGFNMARACQGKQDFCGVYQLKGNQITIVLNRGTYRQTGTRTPGKIEIGDRSYILQGDPAKTPNHALEGVFGRADARPGEDLARKFIRFTRDGRFQDQGLVTTVAGTDITGGNLHFERESGAGTYRLSNFTLILHYSDGYERGLPILIRPEDQDQPMPPAFSVNTYTLVRR